MDLDEKTELEVCYEFVKFAAAWLNLRGLGGGRRFVQFTNVFNVYFTLFVAPSSKLVVTLSCPILPCHTSLNYNGNNQPILRHHQQNH